MNKLITTLVGFVAAGAMLPAFAGPDWQAIEQARSSKRVQLARAGQDSALQACTDRRLVLPLDHGPRAQTTPYENEQRRQRFEAEVKACSAAPPVRAK